MFLPPRKILYFTLPIFTLYFLIPRFSVPSILPSTLTSLTPLPAQNTSSIHAPSAGYVPLLPAHAALFSSPFGVSRNYHEWNEQTLRELHSCIARVACGPNQKKVALLAAHWFDEAIVRGWRGGEGVWALSVYTHLRAMGYTTLFANSFEEALAQYRMFPDLVKVVIRNRAGECHTDPECVKSKANPTGIPPYRIFDFEYFPSPNAGHYHASLMRGPWILSAHPVTHEGTKEPEGVQYIGFSMEDQCTTLLSSLSESGHPIPHSERKHQAFLLMKQLTYVHDSQFAWNTSWFGDLAGDEELSLDLDPVSGSGSDSELLSDSGGDSETGRRDDADEGMDGEGSTNLTFIGAWAIDQHYQWDPETQGLLVDFEDRERGVVNLLSTKVPTTEDGAPHDLQNIPNRLSSTAWASHVAHSKVMLGIGSPYMSPSPYWSLCLGVPFINPILDWDPINPNDRTQWRTQHPPLERFDEPFVYHTFSHSLPHLRFALQRALAHPIPSFIPEHMSEHAVRERVRRLMERDWEGEARVLREERLRLQKEGWDVWVWDD